MTLLKKLRLSTSSFAVVIVAVAALLPIAPAFGAHADCELDVTPETGTSTLGTTHTITAALRPADTDPDAPSTASCTTRDGGAVDVLFEVSSADTNATYSPTSIDRQDTRLQPDMGCTITSTRNTCTVTYTRTTGASSDTIVGWVADEEAVSDTVTKTWTAPQASLLNVTPETDANPPQTDHVLTATVRDANGAVVSGVNVDFEIISGPNTGLNSTRADLECSTGTSGTCTVDYTDAAGNPAPPNNVDSICAWLDPENDDVYAPFGSVAADGGDCDQEAVGETEDSSVAGSDTFGNDQTDTVTKTWMPPTLTFTPASDSASVGTCNAFTIALRDAANRGISGVVLDVEQVHSTATNGSSGDEPTVSFCTPGSGANPAGVDTSRGDRVENPDNVGTAGGETTAATDSRGEVTIGITVSPAGTSNGTGTVTVTAWDETGTDNDDPATGETTGSATKTWVVAEPRYIDCEPETAAVEIGATPTVSCLVRDRFGAPLSGHAVVFSSTGPGELASAERALTDASGRATATSRAFQIGTQSITATLEADVLGAEPTEVDDCDRNASDPSGSPIGVCSDTVTVSWTMPTTGSPVPTICQTTPDAFIGTDGNDVITGTSGDDVICGRGGNDRLVGSDGNDLLIGGAGVDMLLGGEGSDRLSGGEDADVLTGGAGSDRLSGGEDADVLTGGDGADFMSGGDGNDRLVGKGEDDTLRGNDGSDSLGGGRGDDTLNGGGGRDTCEGGPGQDRELGC